MAALYINSYAPLACSALGREAARVHGLPPFVDGSIRREPDLEHEFPAISCLCRADKFAPRLRVSDVVMYLTKKERYGARQPHRRLTAVLEVLAVLASHADAAAWYKKRGMPLPNNCMVAGNRPHPLDESHRRFRAGGCAGDARTHRSWEAGYRARARRYPTFVVCRPLFRELSWNAPVVEDAHMIKALGHLPGTQNPGALPLEALTGLMRAVGIDVRPSAP